MKKDASPTGQFHARYLSLVIVLLALAASSGNASAPVPGPTDPDEVLAFVDRFVERADGGRPLTSAAFVLVRDQDALVSKGYGYADAAKSVPVDPNRTVFRAASISKVFTATAVMQLVEEGKIRLDADVNTYLKLFQLETRYDRPVVVADLLTHTAGFEDRFFGDLARPGHQVPLGDYFTRSTPRRAMPPGTQISYSNHGMALAGYLVEVVSGQPFDAYVEEHLLQPLGMLHSTLRQPPPGDWQLGATRIGGKQPPAIVFNPYPAASLVCTPADMARFLRAQLNSGAADTGRILRPETLTEMHRQQWSALPGTPMPGAAYGFFESLGHGRRALFHTGDSGHHSLLYLMPAERVGFFLIYSGDDHSSEIREKFVAAFLEHYYPAPPFSLPVPAPGFAPHAREFTGTYRSNQFSRSNFEKIKSAFAQVRISDGKDGTLLLHPPGGGATSVRLVEIAPDLFRTDEEGYVGFRRTPGGRVESFTVTGSVWDPGTWETIPWYQSGIVSLVLLVGVALLLATRALLWPIVGLVRRLRRLPRLGSPSRGAAGLAWRLSGVASWLVFLAPILAFAVAVATLRPPVTSVPAALVTFLLLLFLAVALGVSLIPIGVAAWRQDHWTPFVRAHVTAVTLGLLVLGAVLLQYNLLGFRF